MNNEFVQNQEFAGEQENERGTLNILWSVIAHWDDRLLYYTTLVNSTQPVSLSLIHI